MNGLKRFQTVVSMLKTLSADYIERLALMLSEGEFSSQNLNTLAEEERYTYHDTRYTITQSTYNKRV